MNYTYMQAILNFSSLYYFFFVVFLGIFSIILDFWLGINAKFAFIGYLCGSLPFGLWIPLWRKKGDPRFMGSGNIGATNVYRLAGKNTAFLVFLCDFLKGYLPVCLVPNGAIFYAGLGCVVGHIFPWVLKFKGGKGVATSCGVMMAIMPLHAISSFLLWAIFLMITQYASLAALFSATIHFAGAMAFFDRPYGIFSGILALIILYAHRSNIIQLIQKKC
jgi:glycerol-3-phosphate acyltransferase PlsY